jgi:hypothetical protein
MDHHIPAQRRRIMPARYPPGGVWPAQMRADMAAAYLDISDTTELALAVSRGDAPAPSALRGVGLKREPVWARVDLDRHVAPLAPRMQDDQTGENLSSIV